MAGESPPPQEQRGRGDAAGEKRPTQAMAVGVGEVAADDQAVGRGVDTRECGDGIAGGLDGVAVVLERVSETGAKGVVGDDDEQAIGEHGRDRIVGAT